MIYFDKLLGGGNKLVGIAGTRIHRGRDIMADFVYVLKSPAGRSHEPDVVDDEFDLLCLSAFGRQLGSLQLEEAIRVRRDRLEGMVAFDKVMPEAVDVCISHGGNL